MRIIFDLPREWEVESCEINGAKQQVIVQPRFLRNAKLANILFAKVVGDSGRESRTVISVSGVTGVLNATTVKESKTKMAFDAPEEQKAKPETPPDEDDKDRNPAGRTQVTPPVAQSPGEEVVGK